MKVTSIPGPMAPVPVSSSSIDPAARERAISMLTGTPNQQADGHAVNPNSISAEELSAVKPRAQESMDSSTTVEDTQVAEPTEKVKEQEDPLQAQYKMLARREKALRAKVLQQEQALKAKEQVLAEREAAFAAKDVEYSSKYIPKDRLRNDALGVLAEEGLTYEELTQQLLNPTPRDPRTEATISRLESQIKALQDSMDKASKNQVEAQDQQYKSALNQIKTDITQMVNANPEYETIKATGSVQDVVDLIEETFKQTGVVMSNEEAIEEVEQYLIDEAMKLSNIGKIKRRLAANSASSQAKAPAQSAGPVPKQQQTMKTLTNATASTRTLSVRERAILAFKNELK